MRFTAATIALLAGMAAALPQAAETVYETKDVTITSCAPTVTNCPARSHSATAVAAESSATETAVTSAPAVTTSAAESTSPAAGASAGTSAESAVSSVVPSGVSPVSSVSSVVAVPAVSSAASQPPYPSSAAPSISVLTYTTCVPTVSYSTITLSPSVAPTRAATPAVPVGTGYSGKASGTP